MKTIEVLIDLLVKFLDGKIDSSLDEHRIHPQIVHYYTELVRFWSKLNFIMRKTLGSLKQHDLFDKAKFPSKLICLQLMATYLYCTYRVFWESTPTTLVKNELSVYVEKLNQMINFRKFLKKLPTFDWDRALKGKSPTERLSIEEAIPNFVIEHLSPVMSLEMLYKNLQSMNEFTQKTDFTVRFNNLRTDTNKSDLIIQIQEELKHDGIQLRKDPDIPELYHVPHKKRPRVLQNKWYQSGYLIFQDKASALVGYLLDPQPGDLIIDMCAAPGVKTGLIAQYVNDSAVIIATDVHTKRIHQMRNVIKPLNTFHLHLINTDGYTLPVKSDLKFDRILLDAPCTGSGTFLTDPILKWRQNKKFLEQNQFFQRKLLESAIEILKPKGTLVYSTCSLYLEEGEMQIQRYVDLLNPLELPNWLSYSYNIDQKPIPGTARLFPAVHHTQGFFIAKFERKN